MILLINVLPVLQNVKLVTQKMSSVLYVLICTTSSIWIAWLAQQNCQILFIVIIRIKLLMLPIQLNAKIITFWYTLLPI